MKWIKVAIGLVIALSVIPLVVVSVNNLDTPKLKTVEFEVIDIDNDTLTFSENTYNDIHSLAIVNNNNSVSNLITIKVNGVELLSISMSYDINDMEDYKLFFIEGIKWESLTDDKTVDISNSEYEPTIGDEWTMTFDVAKPLPPLVKLLVGFVPLIFVGGILLFMLNKRKKED